MVPSGCCSPPWGWSRTPCRPDNPIGWLYRRRRPGLDPLHPLIRGSTSCNEPEGRCRRSPGWRPWSATACGRSASAWPSPCRCCCCRTGGWPRRWRVVAVAAVVGTTVELVGWVLSPSPDPDHRARGQAVPAARGGQRSPTRPTGSAGAAGYRLHPGRGGLCGAAVPGPRVGPSASSSAGSRPGHPRQPPGHCCWSCWRPRRAANGGLLRLPFCWRSCWRSRRRCCATGWDLDRLVSRTVTYRRDLPAGAALPVIVPAATSRLAEGSGSLAVAAAHPDGGRAVLAGCAAGSRTWSTGASTAAAMTPPGPWTGSRARLRDQVDLDALGRAAGGGRPDHATHPGVALLRPQTGQPS